MPLFIKKIPLFFPLCLAAVCFLNRSLFLAFDLPVFRSAPQFCYGDVLIDFLWGVATAFVIGGFYLFLKQNQWLLGSSLAYTGAALVSSLLPPSFCRWDRGIFGFIRSFRLNSLNVELFFVAVGFLVLYFLIHKAWPALVAKVFKT